MFDFLPSKCVNKMKILVMGILNPYTAERRDVSGNTPPEAQEISQGRGICTPRPERLPGGEARGQSRGPLPNFISKSTALHH